MRGHVQKRGRGSWRLKWELTRHNGERTTRYKTVRGTRRQAEAELATILASLHSGSYVDPNRITVQDLMVKWRDDVAKHEVSAKTFERYAEHVLRVIDGLGHVRLSMLSPLQIQEFLSDLRARGHKRRTGGLSEQTLLHVFKILKAALDQAVRWRLIVANPAADVRPPRPPRREVVTLSAEDMMRLLSAAEGSELETAVLLWLTTGLRRGELLALRWGDVDRERSRLTVARTLEETKAEGLSFRAPKTSRSARIVPLPSITMDALGKHELRQKRRRLAAGSAWEDQGLVFSNTWGGPQRPRNVTKAYAALARRAGLNEVSIHTLRHTHITELLRAGVHPKVVSERAGHTTVAFTLQRYGHALPDMQADAARAAERLVGGLVRR
jgi:integrase